jgi:hypothetical protein
MIKTISVQPIIVIGRIFIYTGISFILLFICSSALHSQNQNIPIPVIPDTVTAKIHKGNTLTGEINIREAEELIQSQKVKIIFSVDMSEHHLPPAEGENNNDSDILKRENEAILPEQKNE